LQVKLETADLGQALRTKAAEALQKFEAIEEKRRGRDQRVKVFQLNASTLTALAKAGVEIERLALGEVTQRVEQGDALQARLAEDLAGMSAEQRLALYAAILSATDEADTHGSHDSPTGAGAPTAGN
jgi:hypothetical protein